MNRRDFLKSIGVLSLPGALGVVPIAMGGVVGRETVKAGSTIRDGEFLVYTADQTVIPACIAIGDKPIRFSAITQNDEDMAELLLSLSKLDLSKCGLAIEVKE